MAFGWLPLLLVKLPVVVLAATAGVWLCYVQHQFETTSWDEPEDWTPPVAALHGSSHYDLPAVLRWFITDIGGHHVHHLVSRIPFYRLPEVLRDHPSRRDVGRLTLKDSLRLPRLRLWDHDARRLVSFREARLRAASASAWPRHRRATAGGGAPAATSRATCRAAATS